MASLKEMFRKLIRRPAVSKSVDPTIVYTSTINISGQVAFWDDTSSITGNNNLFWNSTNKRLGVGTSPPMDMVHVVSPSGQDANLRLEGSGNVTGVILKNTGTGGRDWRIRVNKNTIAPVGGISFTDDTAQALRMCINASGNVGIGTDNPTSKLHVAGNTTAGGNLLPDQDNT